MTANGHYLENHVRLIQFYILIIGAIEVLRQNINRLQTAFTQSNLRPHFALIKMKLHDEQLHDQFTISRNNNAVLATETMYKKYKFI